MSGLFGPYVPAAEARAEGREREFPTVARGLGREGLEDAEGVDEALQLGQLACAQDRVTSYVRMLTCITFVCRGPPKSRHRHPRQLPPTRHHRLPPRLLHVRPLSSSHTCSTLTHTPSLPSFPLLTAHLACAPDPAAHAVLGTTYLPGRASALAGTAEGPSFNNGGGDGGGGAAAAAAKKKKEALKGSRGVEALKKVNVKGMRSLKDMFGGGGGKGKK